MPYFSFIQIPNQPRSGLYVQIPPLVCSTRGGETGAMISLQGTCHAPGKAYGEAPPRRRRGRLCTSLGGCRARPCSANSAGSRVRYPRRLGQAGKCRGDGMQGLGCRISLIPSVGMRPCATEHHSATRSWPQNDDFVEHVNDHAAAPPANWANHTGIRTTSICPSARSDPVTASRSGTCSSGPAP